MSDQQATLPLDLPPVEYREIPDMPELLGYRVGDNGSAWSRWSRTRPKCLTETWKQLRTGRSGYPVIQVNKRLYKISRLVLTAFIGPCPPGMEACHYPDRAPSNCRLTNLRWDTHKNNMADKVFHETDNSGERHCFAKLTDDQVYAIRERVAGGECRSEIASEIGIPFQTVCAAVSGKTWDHVPHAASDYPPHDFIGELNPRAILTAQLVLSIRSQIAAGYRMRILAEAYGVSPSTISAIKHRRIWKHI